MVALPAPFTFTTPFAISTTDVSEEANDQTPSDVEVGGTRVKSGSLTTFWKSDQSPMVGFPTMLKVIVKGTGDPYVLVAACVAVIVAVPAFTSATTEPFIVAMLVSDEVNVHPPAEVEVGALSATDVDVDILAVTSGNEPTTGVGP